MPGRDSRKGGRRRHHHGLAFRIRHKLKHHRWIVPAALIVVVALAAAGIWMHETVRKQQSLKVVGGNTATAGFGYRNITYKGKDYRYNNRITAILYVGLDSDGALHETTSYTSAARADSISLVVLDELHHKMTIIALNRDTITDIRKFTLNGRDRGMMRDHLGYAYTYGNGGEVSAQNVCEAVSQLLYGIPVHEYVVMNLSSMPRLCDAIGPVDVIVPNDDLAGLGYVKGSVVTIDADNLEEFVRSRNTSQDFSHNGRMQRQQTYISAAVKQVRGRLEKEPSSLWNAMTKAESSVETNITRSRYLDLISVLQKTEYGEADYYIPEGTQVAAADHDEFYVDEEKLLDKIVEIFYIEK